MYSATLLVHSWLRWAVIVTGLIAILGGIIGVARKGQWTPADDRAGLWFIIALDVQFLLGLALYFFLSPFTADAMKDFGAAMKNSGLRFWAVEHAFGMLVGVALAHVGRARIRRVEVTRRHKMAAIFFGLAIIAILVSIPWPGTSNGRPLVRW
jgi:hypothetical protein